MQTWVEGFLQATDNAEAPTSYFYWSALSVIAGTVANRVWINKGGLYNLYPNLFIFLISKNSGLGKGMPVKIAKRLLTEASTTRLIVGQNSIQGIITELSRTLTTKGGNIVNTAEATLLAPEFGSFLLEDPKLFTNLTDLYDSQYNEGDWRKTLASRDSETLTDICITGLFAANEVHFKDALPFNAIKGGFLGRTICVYESKRRQLKSLISSNELNEKSVDTSHLVEYLKLLSKLKGQFILTQSAAETYNNWYQDFYNLDKELKDDTGTAERLRDSVLKVAMCCSLSENLSLKIEKKHIEEGLIRCYQIYSSTLKMVLGGGKSNIADQTKAVLTIIAEQEGLRITRQKLLMKGLQSGDFDYIELDRVLEHLFQARILSMENRGKDVEYIINLNNVNALLEREKRKVEDSKEQ